MASLENVEKLRKRANVSYDEAKTALEASGDDLLEAMIYLERLGKVTAPPNQGYYSTQDQGAPDTEGAAGEPTGSVGFGQILRRFWQWVRRVIHKGNTVRFEVWKSEERFFAVPVTVLVILLLCCFWVVLPLAVIGLFFGYRYRFSGMKEENNQVANTVMDTAAKAAENLKSGVASTISGDHPEDQ